MSFYCPDLGGETSFEEKSKEKEVSNYSEIDTKTKSLLNSKETSSTKSIKGEQNDIMKNEELIRKLQKERNEYGVKINRIDHYIYSKEANQEDSYYLGLLQEQRSYLNHLAVIIDLRIRYLNGEE